MPCRGIGASSVACISNARRCPRASSFAASGARSSMSPSPTFGRHVAIELTAANHRQLWVPPGFLHGYATLEADTEVAYKVTGYYAPECDRAVAWNDPGLAIAWPVEANEAILSAKDTAARPLAEHPVYFRYEN